MGVEDKGGEPAPAIPGTAKGPGKLPGSLFSDLLAELESPPAEPPAPAPIPKLLVCPAALESMPHLQKKVEAMWGSPDLAAFISTLFHDSRDGARKGLPMDVAAELMFLPELDRTLTELNAAARSRPGAQNGNRSARPGDPFQLVAPQAAGALQPNDLVLPLHDANQKAPEGAWHRLMRLLGSSLPIYLMLATIGGMLLWLWSTGAFRGALK